MQDPDVSKGKNARNQLLIWDRLLEIRIQLQKILPEVNVLPQCSIEELLANSDANDETGISNVQNLLKESQQQVQALLLSLLDVQETLLDQNPEVCKPEKPKSGASAAADDDEEIPSDDEVINGDSSLLDKDLLADDDEELGEEEDVGEDSEEDDDDKVGSEEDEVAEKRTFKKRKIEDVEQEIEERMSKFTKYRNDTIQKWNDKTQLSSGKRNFSAFQSSTLHQIGQVMKDMPRLVKRTQLKRSQYDVIGKPEEEPEANDTSRSGNEYDPEIFDDDDFYHQLLRELIDRKTANVTDPIELSQRWLQIQKLRNKMKKKVDTKASKGRKIRYDVMPKLVNFMAPFDNCPMSDHAVRELYSSLFGNQKQVRDQLE